MLLSSLIILCFLFLKVQFVIIHSGLFDFIFPKAFRFLSQFRRLCWFIVLAPILVMAVVITQLVHFMRTNVLRETSSNWLSCFIDFSSISVSPHVFSFHLWFATTWTSTAFHLDNCSTWTCSGSTYNLFECFCFVFLLKLTGTIQRLGTGTSFAVQDWCRKRRSHHDQGDWMPWHHELSLVGFSPPLTWIFRWIYGLR